MAPSGGSKGVCLLEEFAAHGATVTCVSLGTKSGRVMATGSDDKKVNLWAVGKPICIVSLSGHTTALESVRFGPNEDLVCAGATSGSLKIWDLDAAKILRTFVGHKSPIKSLDFHPYGDFLAASDSAIKLWDIRKKGCIYTYKGHSKPVQCLRFSPDGRWLVSGGDEGIVKLWDLPAGKLLAELKDHTGPVTDVAFHPNELLLSSSSLDGSIKFWDLETFQLVSTTNNDLGSVLKIIFDPEGKVLLSAPKDQLKVTTWEPSRILDSVTVGWGKIKDMTITSSNQLVAAATCLTNVSVHVVDLNNLKPFSSNPLTRQSSSSSSAFGQGREAVMRQSSSSSSAFGQGREAVRRRTSSSSGQGLREQSSIQLSASLSSLYFPPGLSSNLGMNKIFPPGLSSNLGMNKIDGELNYQEIEGGSISSSSSLFGMRSMESLNSSFTIPTTASLNKLCNHRPTAQRPVVTIDQKEQSLQVSSPMKEMRDLSGHWNNLVSSSSSSHLFHHLYSSSSPRNKNSSNNKSLQVLPPISKPITSSSIPQVHLIPSSKTPQVESIPSSKTPQVESIPGSKTPSSSIPQVEFFLSQKQLERFENQREEKSPGRNVSSSSGVKSSQSIKDPVHSPSTDVGSSNGEGTRNQSTILEEPLPNLAATNSNNIHTITNEGNNFSKMKSQQNPSFPSPKSSFQQNPSLPSPTSSSQQNPSFPSPKSSFQQNPSLPSPTSSSHHHPSSSAFCSLSKSKSQVSLVKPVFISNGHQPSINSSGAGHHHHPSHALQTSSSSANLLQLAGGGGGGGSGGRSSNSSSMVRSLPLRTAAGVPVQPVPSQRVQPQTPSSHSHVSSLHQNLHQNPHHQNLHQNPHHQNPLQQASHHGSRQAVPTLKTAAVVFPTTENQHLKTCSSVSSTQLKQDENGFKQDENGFKHSENGLKHSENGRCQDVIPETRDHPAGLDIDDFLPKHLQHSVRLGLSQPEMPEPEAMNEMMRGHRSLVTALAHRKKSIQIVLAVWSSKDPIKALDQAIQLEDHSVLVDLLNVINLKPSFWTLDLCQMLLPSIHELLQSKYESYMSVGCTSLKLILKNFSTMITSNITAPPGIGVDISREERYNKCMTCYKHLLSVRAFLLKRQTMQGKLGRSFRELSILMQTLEG